MIQNKLDLISIVHFKKDLDPLYWKFSQIFSIFNLHY